MVRFEVKLEWLDVARHFEKKGANIPVDTVMIRTSIEEGRRYLVSKVVNGLCYEFHQLRHGPSWAWTTACVGSTLSEFGAVPEEMVDVVLSLQCDDGGWAYNPDAPPDADSTLRVLQFLRKIGFEDKKVIARAEHFVALHQQPDGGFATFFPEDIRTLGYPAGQGWTMSHPCVTALAVNQIHNEEIRRRAQQYLAARLARSDARAYWWRTPLYVLYEMGQWQGVVLEQDPVEISLYLLLKAKQGLTDWLMVERLTQLQCGDGSFPPSRVFRKPRPHQGLDELTSQEEIVEDKQGIFSTSAAIVALSRQTTLLN